VVRNYENNRLSASMLRRHLFGHGQISVLVGRHITGLDQISVLEGRHLFGHNWLWVLKGDFFEKFLTLLEA